MTARVSWGTFKSLVCVLLSTFWDISWLQLILEVLVFRTVLHLILSFVKDSMKSSSSSSSSEEELNRTNQSFLLGRGGSFGSWSSARKTSDRRGPEIFEINPLELICDNCELFDVPDDSGADFWTGGDWEEFDLGCWFWTVEDEEEIDLGCWLWTVEDEEEIDWGCCLWTVEDAKEVDLNFQFRTVEGEEEVDLGCYLWTVEGEEEVDWGCW